jgi:flagellar motor switch protein FliN/FliY
MTETSEGKKEQRDMSFLQDVSLLISVELGRAISNIGQFLALQKGSVMELLSVPQEPLGIRVNGKLVARGEIVVVNDKYGVRITEIVDNGGGPTID